MFDLFKISFRNVAKVRNYKVKYKKNLHWALTLKQNAEIFGASMCNILAFGKQSSISTHISGD